MARHSSRAGVVTMASTGSRSRTRSWRGGVHEQQAQQGRLDRLERALDGLRVERAGAGQDGLEVDLGPDMGAIWRSPARFTGRRELGRPGPTRGWRSSSSSTRSSTPLRRARSWR